MKNNILLILAVTIISIGIIVATVLISTAGTDNTNSGRSDGGSGTSQTTSASVKDKDKTTNGSSGTTSGEETTAETAEQDEPIILTEEATHGTESTLTPGTGTSRPNDIETAGNIVATAHSLIGIDFMDGGDTPEYGFDNSGFVYYVLRESGYITCPRDIAGQTEMGAAVKFEELHEGDLVYFLNETLSAPAFGGIYCGDGKMIACLMPGTQVKEINITTPYYTKHFYRGVSLT